MRHGVFGGILWASCLAMACADSARPPSVLLITVDTLRADHLGAYASGDTRTPRLDELARGGTVFENAVAPMPLTRPSHFSILTSLYPREHGVLNNAIALPDSAVSLAEIFRDHGYRTGAFVSVALLDEESGAAQGFDTFTHPTDPRERSARATVAESLDWVSSLPAGEPFFLWVHLFDPHLPYAPPLEYRDPDAELAASLPEIGWTQIQISALGNDGDVPRAVFDHARELYRGEVKYTDHWVGRLLDGLADQRRRQDTIVAFTADHGEGFEHGVFFEHADSLYDGVVRIPLILWYPPEFAPGARVAAQVSNLDLAPTLLVATGIEIPPGWSGRPLQQAASFGDRYVLIQHPFYQPRRARNRARKQSAMRSVAGLPVADILVEEERVGIVGTEWKLVRQGDAVELYRRTTGEGSDLSAEHASLRQQLDDQLARELEARPLNLIDTGEINQELLNTLKALGYIQE